MCWPWRADPCSCRTRAWRAPVQALATRRTTIFSVLPPPVAWWASGIGKAPYATPLAGVVKAIRYAVGKVGVAHVALGSDFDGATRMPFDATGLPALTDALLKAGFSIGDVRAIMGGNVSTPVVSKPAQHPVC